ncbi:MAG: hypothetical protein IT373_04035, partial [Polyangiaceae bacterium]|nr:hypothetical protein [Polyangiaceae bacterium]
MTLAPALRRGVALAALAASAALGLACPPRPAPVPEPPVPSASSGTATASGPHGAVRCGAARCRVPDERCCHGAEGDRCVPDDGSAYCPDRGTEYASMACDDPSDCRAGDVCCLQMTPEGTQATRCSPHPCPTAEVCVPGAAACHEGLRCEAEHGDLEGRCVAAAPRARCGGRDCAGAEPECCFSHAAELATCGKPGSCDRHIDLAFGCASRADCGGYFCCQYPGGYACAGSCGGAGALCATVDDCPARAGAPAVDCAPLPGPAILGVKGCVYAD